MNAALAPSLRAYDDMRLGANLRALFEAVRWPEYEGITISLSIDVGETIPSVTVWHHESFQAYERTDIDRIMRIAAEEVTKWTAEHPQEAPKSKREKKEAR